MANYATLKAAIQAAIYENGNNEITGTALQQSLLSMVEYLGTGYQYLGVATLSTNPGTPDYKGFYLAATSGVYPNFNGAELEDGEIAIFINIDGWIKVSLIVVPNKATIDAAIATMENSIGTMQSAIASQDADIEAFKQTITNQINNFQPIVIEGNVTNAPDEEDLTTENDLLKFANRGTLNGMGYVILRRNKTFAEQVTLQDTIYEIRYDFDLGGASVTIPAGCVLKFVGGSISNGTIVFNGTYLDAFSGVAFRDDVNVSGMVGNEYVIPEWFGAVGDGTINDTPAIQKAIDVCNNIVGIQGKTYAVSADVHSSCLTIKRDHQSLTLDLIDIDTYNNPDYRGRGVIFLDALNYFRYIGTITSVNDSIPVSASSGDSLEFARGGIVCWGDCGYLDIKMSCSNLYGGVSSGAFITADYLSRNGTKGVHDSYIDVKAKRIAYPVALNYGNKNTINVFGEEMHRCVYICGDYNTINACGRDYYATASPAHILLLVNFILENGVAVLKTSNYNTITYKEMMGETHFINESSIFQYQPDISDTLNPPEYTKSAFSFVGNEFNIYCSSADKTGIVTYIFKSPVSTWAYDYVVTFDMVVNIFGDASNYLFRGVDFQVEGLKNNAVFNNNTPQKLRFDIRDNNAESIYIINGNQNTYVRTLEGKVYLRGGEVDCSEIKSSEMNGQVYIHAANPNVVINSEYNRKHTHIDYFDNYPVRTALLVNPAASQIGMSCFDTQKGFPLFWDGTQWITADGVKSTIYRSGSTSYRPNLSLVPVGYIYFDTTLGKSIVSNGTAWVNMDGTALE